ncbi:MAG: RagB/SusD family nutrient uptake outer membrane protein, partial [Tidjanibacter sp.]|nr:RagB/SusD family nutrient uptake outer membrane protein [Tidjanibacter sp.]
MKMTTHIKHLIVALVVAFTATSCLDKEPGSAIPTDEAMQSFNDAEQTVTGIYALMKSSALWSGYLTLLPDVQTDLVYAV